MTLLLLQISAAVEAHHSSSILGASCVPVVVAGPLPTAAPPGARGAHQYATLAIPSFAYLTRLAGVWHVGSANQLATALDRIDQGRDQIS